MGFLKELLTIQRVEASMLNASPEITFGTHLMDIALHDKASRAGKFPKKLDARKKNSDTM